MNSLKLYLNKKTPQEQEKFASSCGTSVGYMRKIICSNGGLLFGASLARQIEEKSNGEISRKDLRPNDWHKIWPELKNKKSA